MIREQVEKDLEPLKVEHIVEDNKGDRIHATYAATEEQVQKMLGGDYMIEDALESADAETKFVIRPTTPL